MQHFLQAALLCTSLLGAGPWNLEQLSQTPATHEAPDLTAEGVRGIYYETLPWRGNPTRAFAWLGVPEHTPGEKLPAMVLAHGGGGTAYDEWVRLWTDRGYVAIAMDLEGALPQGEYPDRPKHEWSGPLRTGGFEDIDEPAEDQWYYHAVADIILAHSLLRAMPEVDSERIGLTGISWGGILSCTVAGVDDRFALVIPVYGCGFLNEAPVFQKHWEALGPEKTQRWHELWDPATYLANAEMPMLWVNGTNDLHFPLSIHSKSYALAQGPKTLSVRVGMEHSHHHGWIPKEIYAFADSLLKGGTPLVALKEWRETQGEAMVSGAFPIGTQCELVYSRDVSDWVAAKWETEPGNASVGGRSNAVAISPLPAECKAWFLNITDAQGLVVSTPVQQKFD